METSDISTGTYLDVCNNGQERAAVRRRILGPGWVLDFGNRAEACACAGWVVISSGQEKTTRKGTGETAASVTSSIKQTLIEVDGVA